jgi:hypothetical protein
MSADKYRELQRHPAYPDVRTAVAAYIHRTIPNAMTTHPTSWNVSCLPSTRKTKWRRRLLTLNCAWLETLYVEESLPDGAIAVTINTDIPSGSSDENLPIDYERFSIELGTYRRERVWNWKIPLDALLDPDTDLDSAARGRTFEDLAAQLNEMLLRHKSCYAKNHCAHLAADLLAEANRHTMEPGDAT